MSYLIFENGTFQSGLPSDYNDKFELVQVFGGVVAFRVVRSEQQSGSGESEVEQVQMSSVDEVNNVQMESHEEASECYLGFEDFTSEPKCYGYFAIETFFRIFDFY